MQIRIGDRTPEPLAIYENDLPNELSKTVNIPPLIISIFTQFCTRNSLRWTLNMAHSIAIIPIPKTTSATKVH